MKTVDKWVIFGALASAVAVQGAGMHTWAEVFSPPFFFGTLGVVGVVIRALYTDKPPSGLSGSEPPTTIAQPKS